MSCDSDDDASEDFLRKSQKESHYIDSSIDTSSMDEEDFEAFRYTNNDSGLRNSSEAQKHREIVVEFPNGAVTFSRMIELIENCPSKYSQVSAMVFRGVFEPASVNDWQSIEQQLDEFKIHIGFDRLTEGVYLKKKIDGLPDHAPRLEVTSASRSSSETSEEENVSLQKKSMTLRSSTTTRNENKKNRRTQKKKRKAEKRKRKVKKRRNIPKGMSGPLPGEVFSDEYLAVAGEASDYIENFFEKYDGTNDRFVYYYNGSRPVREFPFVLDNIIQSGIHTRVHPIIGNCPGINTSMCYLGTKNSFTEMHVEDGLLDSLNIIRAGGRKLWIIVEYYDYLLLNSSLCKDLLDNYSLGANPTVTKTLKDYKREKCPYPTHHKELLLTPKYLDSRGINYRYVLQGPGDVVYLKNAVAHQVWNLEETFAEAINFGTPRWRHCNALAALCTCTRKSLQSIDTDPIACDTTVRRRKKKLPCTCPIDNCESFYRNLGDLEKHLITKIENHQIPYNCLFCRSRYTALGNLHRHLDHWHGTNVRDMKYAYYCVRRLGELNYFLSPTSTSPTASSSSSSSCHSLTALPAVEKIQQLKSKIDRDSAISSGKIMMDIIYVLFSEREKKKIETVRSGITELSKILAGVQKFLEDACSEIGHSNVSSATSKTSVPLGDHGSLQAAGATSTLTRVVNNVGGRTSHNIQNRRRQRCTVCDKYFVDCAAHFSRVHGKSIDNEKQQLRSRSRRR